MPLTGGGGGGSSGWRLTGGGGKEGEELANYLSPHTVAPPCSGTLQSDW